MDTPGRRAAARRPANHLYNFDLHQSAYVQILSSSGEMHQQGRASKPVGLFVKISFRSW